MDCQRRRGLPVSGGVEECGVVTDPREWHGAKEDHGHPGVCRGPKWLEFRRHVGEVGEAGEELQDENVWT